MRYLFLVEPMPKIKAKVQTWENGLLSFARCGKNKQSTLFKESLYNVKLMHHFLATKYGTEMTNGSNFLCEKSGKVCLNQWLDFFNKTSQGLFTFS